MCAEVGIWLRMGILRVSLASIFRNLFGMTKIKFSGTFTGTWSTPVSNSSYLKRGSHSDET